LDKVKKPSDSECKRLVCYLDILGYLLATSKRVQNINVTCPLTDPFVLKPGSDMQREETLSVCYLQCRIFPVSHKGMKLHVAFYIFYLKLRRIFIDEYAVAISELKFAKN
jgi:hypothetical protein